MLDQLVWVGGFDGMLRAAERIAAKRFANAIKRYGFEAEDIAMDGVLKLLYCWAHKDWAPTVALLCWAVDKAGLDKIRREGGPGGGPRPRNVDPDDPRNQSRFGRPVPLPVGDDYPPDDRDHARPDELAHEAVHWGIVAARLWARASVDTQGRGDPTDRRVQFAALAGRVAEVLARRAASDVTIRTAFAEDPRLTIWQVLRTVEPTRFGGYSGNSFPPHEREADRRRAFRIVKRVAEMIDDVHRELRAEAAQDDAPGAA